MIPAIVCLTFTILWEEETPLRVRSSILIFYLGIAQANLCEQTIIQQISFENGDFIPNCTEIRSYLTECKSRRSERSYHKSFSESNIDGRRNEPIYLGSAARENKNKNKTVIQHPQVFPRDPAMTRWASHPSIEDFDDEAPDLRVLNP
jgi:hypothetical protein